MRLLLFLILSGIILGGCNQEQQSEDENAPRDETSEEVSAENSASEEESSEESEAPPDSSEEPEDDNAEGDGSAEESEEDPPEDLLGGTTFKEGYWINYKGEDDPRDHMVRSDYIDYDPEKDYTVTVASYVSYYYGEEFIKTNSYGHGGPKVIEKVPEADRVIISVEKVRSDELEFFDAAMEGAAKGEEVNTTPEEFVGRGRLVEENLSGQIMFGQEFLSEDNLMRGEVIDENGNFVEEENHAVTEALEYDPSASYAITVPASISYYRGSEFMETIEIEDAPAYIPAVDGANYINISFDEEFIYELNVIELE